MITFGNYKKGINQNIKRSYSWILVPFIFSYFGLKIYVQSIVPFAIIIVVGFMLAFGSIKKSRIYKQDID